MATITRFYKHINVRLLMNNEQGWVPALTRLDVICVLLWKILLLNTTLWLRVITQLLP